MSDDADLLRYDDDDDADETSRQADEAGDGYVTALAVTKTISSYPSAAGKFVAFDFKGVTGAETEGGSGTTSTLSGGTQQYAYIPSGATVPASGTEVVVVRVRHRWVLDV